MFSTDASILVVLVIPASALEVEYSVDKIDTSLPNKDCVRRYPISF